MFKLKKKSKKKNTELWLSELKKLKRLKKKNPCVLEDPKLDNIITVGYEFYIER